MEHILDLTRYPLDKPHTPEWEALVARCRADLVGEGMFNLEGLMHSGVAAHVATELKPKFAAESFEHARKHNIYFQKVVPGLAADHPALLEFETSNRTLCADQLGQTALMGLYEWAPFAAFLAATMGKARLHTMADRLAKVNVMSYGAGQALNWHFDRSEFTTTLLLQAPKTGGEFEYCTYLRSADNPNYDGVARLLSGQETTNVMSLSPGTLNVFKGKNTAHRVTPVGGDTARVIAVYSFYEAEGVRFSPEEQVGFYGRAAQ